MVFVSLSLVWNSTPQRSSMLADSLLCLINVADKAGDDLKQVMSLLRALENVRLPPMQEQILAVSRTR